MSDPGRADGAGGFLRYVKRGSPECSTVEVEPAFGVFFSNVVIDASGGPGLVATALEKFGDESLVGVKLRASMTVDKLNSRRPSVEYARPVGFTPDRLPSVEVVLPENETSREILRVVVVVDPIVDSGVQLPRVNKVVSDDVAPDSFRQRIVQRRRAANKL